MNSLFPGVIKLLSRVAQGTKKFKYKTFLFFNYLDNKTKSSAVIKSNRIAITEQSKNKKEELQMKKIILTALLAGSAVFAFAGNVSVNLGGIGVSVGNGPHGTNVGVSIGNPIYYYPPTVVLPAPPPMTVCPPPVYFPERPVFRPAPPRPAKFRHREPQHFGRPGRPDKPAPRP